MVARESSALPVGTLALMATNILVFVGMVASGVSAISPKGSDVLPWGANFGPYTLNGQYWRLLTSTFIHFGILHIALNMFCLWQLGKLLEERLGAWTTVAVYMITGVGASLLSLSWDPTRVSAGASGAVFGIAGALLTVLQFGKLDLDFEHKRSLQASVAKFAFINLLYGLRRGTDNMAHLGGLITGLLIGVYLARAFSLPKEERPAHLRMACVISALAIVLIAVPVIRAKGYVLAMQQAQNAFEHKDYASARNAMQKYVASRPDDAYGRFMLGYALRELGREDEAGQEFERGLALDPGDPYLEVNLASIYVHQHHPDKAVPLFRKGLPKVDKADDDAGQYYDFALALTQTGNPAEAEPALQKCLGLDPGNAKAKALLEELESARNTPAHELKRPTSSKK